MSTDNPTDFARQLELAWAAGFFDGEGCTTLNKHPTGLSYARVAIHQVVLANLERFRAAVGGTGKITGPHPQKRGQSIYKYRPLGNHAHAILEALWPYLGEVKKEQARRVFAEEVNHGGLHPALRTVCPRGHLYDGVKRGKRDDLQVRVCRTCEREQSRERRLEEAGGTLGSPNAQKTHCPQGHPLSGTNLYISPKGSRACRFCRNVNSLKSKQKRQSEKTEASDVNLRATDLSDSGAFDQGQCGRNPPHKTGGDQY